jgi:hypothetical protein
VILVAALCCSLLSCVVAVVLALRRVPGAAFPFRVTARRTRIAAAGCLVAALAIIVGSFISTPRSQKQPMALGAGTTMLVVDLSGSIGPLQYVTIRKTLTALGAQPNRHAGLIFFSDSAAQVLPPQTPASELAAVARFFVRDVPQPLRDRGATEARPASGPMPMDLYKYRAQGLSSPSPEANPWMNAFEGGTAIYHGLNMARRALVHGHAHRGQIVLISDLDDGQDPRTRTALLRIATDRLQMRVVGLDPPEASRRMYLDVFGPEVFVSNPTLAASVQGDRPERASGTRTLIPAALATVVLLGLFSWWQAPLRLRAAER